MIKINLALMKRSVSAGDVNSGRPTSGVLPGGRFDLKDSPIRKIILPGVIAYLASYSLDSFKEEELGKIQSKISKIGAERERIQSELDQFKSYESLKKSLDEDEVMVRTKLDTIRNLLKNRSSSLEVLLGISEALPSQVWITEFTANGDIASTKGSALDFNNISEFMKNLKENSLFTSVEMVDTKRERNKDLGREIALFTLTMKRK